MGYLLPFVAVPSLFLGVYSKDLGAMRKRLEELVEKTKEIKR